MNKEVIFDYIEELSTEEIFQFIRQGIVTQDELINPQNTFGNYSPKKRKQVNALIEQQFISKQEVESTCLPTDIERIWYNHRTQALHILQNTLLDISFICEHKISLFFQNSIGRPYQDLASCEKSEMDLHNIYIECLKSTEYLSQHRCEIVEDILKWHSCVKDISLVWPCLPDHPLNDDDCCNFYRKQLYIALHYLQWSKITRIHNFICSAKKYALEFFQNIGIDRLLTNEAFGLIDCGVLSTYSIAAEFSITESKFREIINANKHNNTLIRSIIS